MTSSPIVCFRLLMCLLYRCLNTLESGGMGEGWSDTLSFWTEQTSTTPADFTLGAWVDNSPAGIRSVPYSTNKKVDPYTYGTVATKDEGELSDDLSSGLLDELTASPFS